MYCRKTSSYGSGAYAKPLNVAPKIGYQTPREDVARPFKARPYNDHHTTYYSVYKSPACVGPPPHGPAVSPMKPFEDRQFERSEDPTVGARGALHNRDARLNTHKAGYGEGNWKGSSQLAPGGGTFVVPEKPRPRTVPCQPGTDGSLSHEGYGGGVYVPEDRLEHPDCSGFTKLSKRQCHSPTKLTPKPTGCKGNIGHGHHNGHRSVHAPPPADYGAGSYASPAKGDPEGVAGVHFGSRAGGVSEAKYLPTHREAIHGQNATVADYGYGSFASPKKVMVHSRYAEGHGYDQRLHDHPGYGAYVTPRSGIY